ncbi:MAG: SAM-dependent methyltransferase [bacterium]|nr:SAM-dependent methyltransferase [bacterium]
MTAKILSIVLILLVVYAAGSIIIGTIKNGISPMPSSPKMKKAMLAEIVKLDISGKVYELGSGWGTLAFSLAGILNTCEVHAFENSPVPRLFTRLLHAVIPHKNLYIHKKDFYSASLTDADLVVCYLFPGGMEKLEKKFGIELKENALVLSSTFALPFRKPVKEIVVNDIFRSKIYLYKQSNSTREFIV